MSTITAAGAGSKTTTGWAGEGSGGASSAWSAMRSGGAALAASPGDRAARRLQNPIEACPIVQRVAAAPEPHAMVRPRMTAVLLLLLLLL